MHVRLVLNIVLTILSECIKIEVHTGRKGNEIQWELGGCEFNYGRYESNTIVLEKCCGLKSSWNTLNCNSNGIDGWPTGYLVINGREYCDDNSWRGQNHITTGVNSAGKNILSKVLFTGCIFASYHFI